MQVTREMLARALCLRDEKLLRLIGKWRRQYGIDPALFGIKEGDAASVRHALAQATAEDLRRLNEMLRR